VTMKFMKFLFNSLVFGPQTNITTLISLQEL